MMRSIGDQPPKEPFTTVPADRADEESHFVFEFNSADLQPDAPKKLGELVEQRRGTLLIDIHGYASTEGGPAYNVNLAAHRAAAVQRQLLPLLPRGSMIELYSHGETDVWGEDRALNRRAGIHVWRGPAPTPPFRLEPILPPLTLGNPDVDPFGNPKRKVDLTYRPKPEWVDADPKKPAYDPFHLPPIQRPPHVMDWSSLRGPFTNRGVRLSERDLQSVEDNWNRTYLWGIGLGLSPDTASLAANKLTTAAYDIQLARENPNFWDRVDQEDTRVGISKSPMVPVITPESIRFLSKTLFKRDLDLKF
jgi:OmpA family